MSWIDDIMDLLCRMYKDLGGDCKDLYGPTGQPQPTKVVDQYQKYGAPVFTDPADKASFLALLDEVEAKLLEDDNSFTAADTAALLATIENLRKDLG